MQTLDILFFKKNNNVKNNIIKKDIYSFNIFFFKK